MRPPLSRDALRRLEKLVTETAPPRARTLSERIGTVALLKGYLSPGQLEAATRTLTLPEAMRLGATVTTRAHGWGAGGSACALSAARIGGRVAGYCE